MSIISKLIIIVLFMILPIIVGGIWTKYLDNRDKFKLLIEMWVYGMVTIFAITQLVAVPMIARRMSFTSFVYVWLVAIGIVVCVSVYSLVKLVIHHEKRMRFKVIFEKIQAKIRNRIFILILAIVAFLLIFMQAFISSQYQHSDDDDSRGIALEVIACNEDTMLTQSPIDGEDMTWQLGEVRKDLTSPWTMQVALYSKLSGVHPAAMSHVVISFVFIYMSYMAYILLALNLFKGNYEKTIVFMILLSMLNIFGYTSTHTLPSLMLLRTWQGKAIFAGFIIPVMLNLMCELLDDYKNVCKYVLLTIAAMGASLMSGAGIIIGAVMIGTYGIVQLIKNRKIISCIATWICASPCVIYAICYYLWDKIFKLYP